MTIPTRNVKSLAMCRPPVALGVGGLEVTQEVAPDGTSGVTRRQPLLSEGSGTTPP